MKTALKLSILAIDFAPKRLASLYFYTNFLRPIYTEELPGVAAHDSLLVLLHTGVAVPSRARAQNYPTQQNKESCAGTPVWIGL